MPGGNGFVVEPLDRKCPSCSGSGRAASGDANVDALEGDIARLKWRIADLTEEYGLDLRRRKKIPGESAARKNVSALQGELATKLKELETYRLATEGKEVLCPQCHGRGLVLTKAGEEVLNFICRWIHPGG